MVGAGQVLLLTVTLAEIWSTLILISYRLYDIRKELRQARYDRRRGVK